METEGDCAQQGQLDGVWGHGHREAESTSEGEKSGVGRLSGARGREWTKATVEEARRHRQERRQRMAPLCCRPPGADFISSHHESLHSSEILN